MSENIIESRKEKRNLTPCEKLIYNIVDSIFIQVIYIILLIAYVITCTELNNSIIKTSFCFALSTIMFIICLIRIYLKGIQYLNKRDVYNNIINISFIFYIEIRNNCITFINITWDGQFDGLYFPLYKCINFMHSLFFYYTLQNK